MGRAGDRCERRDSCSSSVTSAGDRRSSVVRSDPSLATELQLGGWFDSDWRLRTLRRLSLRIRRLPLTTPAQTAKSLRLAADLAFWRGVRAGATPEEWRRLAGSSYVVLVYHRLAGERKPGQERVDLSPAAFASQLRLLRLTGFRHLGVDELLAFHERVDAVLPRRRFVVTVDDALSDCRAPLEQHGQAGMHLYVPTAEIGGAAHWLDGEPLLSWSEIRSLAAAGIEVGAHARHHRRLSGLMKAELVDELSGSLLDLGQRLGSSHRLLAYPYGDHDLAAWKAARSAGFRAAFTTEKGRNGAGTDRYCLRRVSVHEADGAFAVLWKALTGEALPTSWQRLRSSTGRLSKAGPAHVRGTPLSGGCAAHRNVSILNSAWSRPGSSQRARACRAG